LHPPQWAWKTHGEYSLLFRLRFTLSTPS